MVLLSDETRVAITPKGLKKQCSSIAVDVVRVTPPLLN